MKKQKVYLDTQTGDLLVMTNKIKANTHDTIYSYDLPLKDPKKPLKVDTMLSPGKSGFVSLGAL